MFHILVIYFLQRYNFKLKKAPIGAFFWEIFLVIISEDVSIAEWETQRELFMGELLVIDERSESAAGEARVIILGMLPSIFFLALVISWVVSLTRKLLWPYKSSVFFPIWT